MRLVACLLALAGCGRIGFDVQNGDAAVTSGADGSDAAMAIPRFGQWKLDDGSGTLAADSSGNGHPMMLVNGPMWTTAMFGGGVKTAGTTDYLTVPLLELSGTSAVTVSLWVNRTYTSASLHTLFELSPNFNGSATGFGLFPDDTTACSGEIQVSLNGDTGYSGTCYTQPSSGVWHHLVAVFDKSRPGNSETALYIDGVLAAPTSHPNVNDNTNTFGNEPLFLGSRGGTQEFNISTFDEIEIYDRALTAAEIATL